MNPLVRLITGRRTAWLVALVPFLFALVVAGMVPEGEREATALDTRPEGADSSYAIEMNEKLPAEEGMVAIVLWTAEEGDLDQAQLGAVTAQAAALQQGGAPDGPPAIPSEDGTAAFTVVPVQSDSNRENIDKVEQLREDLRAELPDGVDVQVTGPAGIQADIGQVFDGANFRLLLATASVVALLLIITYRSPVLWLIPLIVVAVADRFAAIVSTNALEQLGMVWDDSTVGILSVLVFGAGTNYALLLISRYRDELKSHESRHEAMAKALARTAEAVLASATTVIVGLVTLLLSAVPSTRGLGMACAIGIVIAAGYALVVLPATLLLFGRWVFWPRVPRVGDTVLVDSHSVWWRVGQAVAARPRTFVVGTVLALAAMAAGLLFVTTGLKPAEQFLEKPEAITASERLAESFPAGTTDPIQVLTRADAGEVLAAVSAINGVDSARPAASADGITRIDAIPTAAPGSTEARETVEAVRDAVADFDDTHVGGGDAEAVDDREWSQRDRMVIFPLILVLVLGALLLLLRSVVAPVLLVLTVVGTYAAAMGTSWWIFRYVFDFTAMDIAVPLYAFLFLVALGVDYNIFLVTRAREEAQQHGTRAGMLRALTATGGVITSAGILLAAVFAVLGVLPLVVLAQLGAVIFVGVLLDTLVVRTVLVPALAVTLGGKFWWPRKPARVEEAAG
ncbi:MAG: MMPL family transporter [Nocardioides sp.]|nr:MMPL family transporter [Nocardioides sp.]